MAAALYVAERLAAASIQLRYRWRKVVLGRAAGRTGQPIPDLDPVTGGDARSEEESGFYDTSGGEDALRKIFHGTAGGRRTVTRCVRRIMGNTVLGTEKEWTSVRLGRASRLLPDAGGVGGGGKQDKIVADCGLGKRTQQECWGRSWSVSFDNAGHVPIEKTKNSIPRGQSRDFVAAGRRRRRIERG